MLNHLSKSTVRKSKRIGRGAGSGKGKSGGRGTKGQKSRNGKKFYVGFEGGQTRLAKRTPKLKGLRNLPKPSTYDIINLSDLRIFASGSVIDKKMLLAMGLIKDPNRQIKLLAGGEITVGVTIKIEKVSAAAHIKLDKAGCKVESV
jgi:large subunit ribosomal protein L15